VHGDESGGRSERLGPRLLLALGLLSAAGPIAMDFYMASLPDVQDTFHSSATSAELTLTGFLIGLGLGQLCWGPLTDRFGRRGPLLAGSVVALLASLMAALAPSIEVLVVARFVQALAAACGVVVSRAVIADRLTGPAAAHAMSLMMTINSVAPVVAPLVGGVLASANVSWRVVLGVVCGVMALQLLAAFTTIRESLPPERRTASVRVAPFGHVLRKPAFVGYGLTQMFGFAALMAYISSSSFVYQRVIGTSGLVYGLVFALNATGMIVAGLLSARLVRRGFPPARIVAWALPGLLACALLALLIAATSIPHGLLTVAFLGTQVAMGFVMGNAIALAIDAAREYAGVASGVVGAAMFLLGGALSPLGGAAGGGTAVPLGFVMVASALCACVSFGWVRRGVRAVPA